jgi:hypothetical protein
MMIKHFVRWRTGWWILHLLVVIMLLWLGYQVQF